MTSTVGSGASENDSTYQLEVIATNGQSEAVSGGFTLTNGFAPPAQLNALANQSTNPGTAVAVVQSTTFSDPYAHGLTYSATLSSGAALPAGLSWGTTGITVGTMASGSYAIKVTATDGLGHTGSATFTLTVNNLAPVFTGTPTNLTLATGTAMPAYQGPAATDANGDAITYSTSALPAGLSFNASTRTFSGTPTATGTTTVTLTATDAKGAAVHTTFTITVNAPVNNPPVYNGGIPAELDFYYGQSNSYAFASHFTNPTGRVLTYTLTLASGTLPTNMSFNGSTGVLSGTLAGIKHDNNLGSAVIKATDATDGKSVSVTFDLYLVGTGLGTEVVGAGPLTAAGPATSLDTMQTTQVQTETAGTTPNLQSYWFTYDADNRVVVNDGVLVGGTIQVAEETYGTPSYANQYDAAGNVAVRVTVDSGVAQSQRLVYDVRNELVETDYANNMGVQQRDTYDADGRQLIVTSYFRSDSTITTYGTPDQPYAWVTMSDGGWLSNAQISQYNADGEVTSQSSYARSSINDWQRTAILRVDNGEDLPNEYTIAPDGTGPLDWISSTTYTKQKGSGSFDFYFWFADSNPIGHSVDTILRFIFGLMVALLPVSSAWASDTATKQRDAEISRYLREAQFAPSYRHGIEVFVARSGQSNSTLRAILAASDDKIITAVLPAFRQELTVKQAHAIADFYASDVGKAMTRQQVASIDNPSTPLDLTKIQQRSLTKFMATDAGQAGLRMHQKAFLLKVNECIGNTFNAKN